MNNANYLRAAEEFLPTNFPCHEVDIVYNKEAMEGEIITPYLYSEENGIGISFENQSGETLTRIMLIKEVMALKSDLFFIKVLISGKL